MKTSARLLFVLIVLLIFSAACSSGGSQTEPAAADVAPAATEAVPAATEPPVTEAPAPTETPAEAAQAEIETEFPLPGDAFNMIDLGNDMISFQTKLKQAEILAFYRDEFSKAGYTEREITTSITDTTLSIVFDGHASGQAIVVQGVDLGGDTTNITIRFEAV